MNVYDSRSLFVICHNNTLRRSRSDSDWIDIKIIRARHQEATFFTRYLPFSCCCTWKNANIFTASERSRQWKRPTIDKFSVISTKLTVFRLPDFPFIFQFVKNVRFLRTETHCDVKSLQQKCRGEFSSSAISNRDSSFEILSLNFPQKKKRLKFRNVQIYVQTAVFPLKAGFCKLIKAIHFNQIPF